MSYINWKVETYETHHAGPTALPVVEVSLSGDVRNVGAYKSRRPQEIIREIEHLLNRGETHKVSYDNKEPLAIKNVIFNPPATIVFWADGTKTVVKCQDGDQYDNEVGLAMAIAKKALGNKGNYCNVFKKWLPECDDSISIEFDGNELLARMGKAVAAFDRVLNRRHQNDHS